MFLLHISLTNSCLLFIVQFVESDTVSSVSETILMRDHIRELKKKLHLTLQSERAIFLEHTHKDNHGLPYAQAFAYLLCTHARLGRRWVVALLLGQGGGEQEISGTPDP